MNSDNAQPDVVKPTVMVSRRTFTTWAMIFGFGLLALTIACLTLIVKINHRAGVRSVQSGVTSSEQASTRLLVCTGLEALPQSMGVKALEAIPYPVYGQPTRPYCPAPMPKGTP